MGMSREILFRGKSELFGWIEGWYVPAVEWGGHQFPVAITHKCPEGWLDDTPVIPETVGQYTGLTDKNGRKIFEGDIVQDGKLEYKLLCDRKKKPRTGRAVVKFGKHEVPSDDPFCWGDAYGFYFEGDTLYPSPASYDKCEFEVIGNIHDNPELLGGGENADY